ncbi:similar to oxidoreductase [Plenodomus lingam JN3]|uniref:Similar to oxidoreductase n=1 Tax=Leptosphaeria maculans (strain JN3 / isolate v23.1.3 / race Av1-4-5-6-7-8) TaxID=985895 RepID=E4ZI79_LEPMJ|nr:similar to oxidoreductase [Plenodomus lingam JN3]CBX90740.1 similar to oxidoreductase [Plenodomus lingam JN3]
MKALKVQQPGLLEVLDVERPKIRPGFCLVKVQAVALNPTDHKHLHYISCEGCTLGCDYAGIIEEVRPGSSLKKGDRIFGFLHGANLEHPEDGAFSQYTLVREGLQAIIPKSLSFEQAASLGVAITTVGMGLCQTLQLPLPGDRSSENTSVLIYGGSTATGTMAIQIARLAGLDVITTCSPANFALVKSLGASVAFDYNDPRCAEDIFKHTRGQLYHALDCISEGKSVEICSEGLSKDTAVQPARYCSTLPVDFPRKDVISTFILAYTAVGEAFHKIIDHPANVNDYNAAKKFWGIYKRRGLG